MNHAMLFLLGVLVSGVLLILVLARTRADHDDIEDWAIQNGYHLLESQKRYVLLSPFGWQPSLRNNPYAYYVEVLTPEHRIRQAWVRINGDLPGITGDTIDVRWGN